MKTKKNPQKNLENYSSVFTLLGLVLSLFITLLFIEQKTYASEKPTTKFKPTTLTMDDVPTMVNVVIEEKKQPKTEKPLDIKKPIPEPQTKPIDFIDPTKFKKTDNTPLIEKPIASTDHLTEKTITDLSDIEYYSDIEEVGVETIPFKSVDNIPVFPGCEKYIHNKEKSKKCFNKKMGRFFGDNFDIGLAENLHLSGIQKISCQFIINSSGEINPDIQTSKTHPELAEEIKNVIKKLPKMIPAKQNGKAVNLIYRLPVKFYVE